MKSGVKSFLGNFLVSLKNSAKISFFYETVPNVCDSIPPKSNIFLYNFALDMATITKRELAIKIADSLAKKGAAITQQDVFDVIQTLIEETSKALSKGDSVVMRNFGTFQVRELKPKIGRNPKDPSKDVPIPARAVVKFRPGKEMKEQVASTLQLIRERKQRK